MDWGGGGRTAQLIVKFGEKVLQIDYRCCNNVTPPQPKFLDPPLSMNILLPSISATTWMPGATNVLGSIHPHYIVILLCHVCVVL